MKNFKKDKLVTVIKNYINNKKETGIIAAYLFGSYATGKAMSHSDIDIAILLDELVDSKDYINIKLDVMADLSSCLGAEWIDLVILNEAPHDLAYSVIKDGTLVFEHRDTRGQLVSFKARTYDRYFDYLPVKKIFSEALLTRIREGRYGG